MREFKIVQMNRKGELVTEHEMFSSMDSAERWAEEKNAEQPGTVVDIELLDCNEELKYEY